MKTLRTTLTVVNEQQVPDNFDLEKYLENKQEMYDSMPHDVYDDLVNPAENVVMNDTLTAEFV